MEHINGAKVGHLTTIICVDDDPQVLDLVTRLLHHFGYVAIPFMSGNSALEFLIDPSHQVDLLLTDVVMPALSGVDLAKKALEIRPDIKIVFMSGFHGCVHDVDCECKRLSRFYLNKPFDFAVLKQVIEKVINGDSS